MPEFLQPGFWLTLQPPLVTQGPGRLAFILFAVMVGLGIAVRIVASRRKEDRYVIETFRRIGRLLTVMGLVGVVLAFFGYERVRFLGARFWYPIWLAATVAWALWILRYARKHVPEMRRRAQERREREKYLPKSKKKKRKKRD